MITKGNPQQTKGRAFKVFNGAKVTWCGMDAEIVDKQPAVLIRYIPRGKKGFKEALVSISTLSPRE